MKPNKVILFLFLIVGFSQGLGAQCGTAYLTADDSVVCVPRIVRFKVHSFPVGTTFEWDLGSGYVSSDSTYTKLYGNAGSYNVRVKLKYLDGSSCIINQADFITGKAVPIPAYTISRTVICKYNDSFTLTDVTPNTVQRDWLVDNTLYSKGPKSLNAIFNQPAGYKSFTIFMKDSFGCEGKRTFDSVAFVSDSLSVDFDVDHFSGCTPKLVNFENLTDTLGNAIASWNWSFPGGAVPSNSNQYEPKNILYNIKDTFDVSLIVTTKKGCVYQHFEKDFLMFADSVSISATFSKTTICANEKLTVNLQNTRSVLPEMSIRSSFYKDTMITPTKRVVKFTNFGVFSFYISDEINGCKSEKYYNSQVQVNGPVARIHIPNGYSCLRPDTLLAVDSSYINFGVSKTYQWDLYSDLDLNNSIQTGTSQPMPLVCSNYGKYTVRLIVTGSNGCKDTAIRPSALEIKKIIPDFTWSPKPACPAEVVQFSNKTPRGTSKAKNRYRWTFYNLNGSVLYKDTINDPKLTYPDTGKYTVKLLAFNNLGCKDSITYFSEIEIASPLPQFIVYDSSVCYGQAARVKAKYLDSNFYTDYNHRWRFFHVDSVKQIAGYTGDSVNANLVPGEYIVEYSRFSKRNTCYDTFILKNRIRVSGAKYAATIDPVKVCNPATPTLNAKLLFNYNFKNSSIDPITYSWSHGYDTNKVVIRKPLQNPTPVFIKKSGYFYFKFKYIHSSGCNDSVFTTTITSGVVSSYIPNKNQYYACVGKPLILINRSDKDAIAFKWFMKDSGSGAYFTPSDTSKNPRVIFGNAGIFKLGLIAFGNGSCTDTSYGTLYVNDIHARFTSTDTLNYCAPVIARIVAERHPAIFEYRWYLGNGDSVTNNLSTFAHLYQKNTGPQGSDVKLVVKAYGCNDTLDKKGFIKVIGPIPQFRLNNNNGCETLRVQFINESKFYNRFFLEYGDGSVLDSINFNYHNYQIFDRSLPSQKFKPVLSVLDSFGCFVQFTKDSILVLKSPESNFTVNRDTGCSSLSVSFRNITIGGVSFKWDFDGNGTIDNATFAPKHNYPAGEYNPVLISKASNGCEDTVRNLVNIKSYARPNASFTTNVDTICYNGAIQFTGSNSPSNSDIKSWLWDFGDPFSIKDSSTKQNPTYNFKKIFLSQVLLLVTDKNNCTDTSDRYIYVQDTIGPVSAPMHYVTVSNNKDIDIRWGKSKFQGFDSYNLFNDNSNVYSLLYSSPNKNDTVFKVLSTTGINVNTSRYCYVIRTKDFCKNLGVVTYPHCTIFLEVDNDSANELLVNWLPYEGWGAGNVRKYRIYRSVDGSPFTLYDSTSNSTNTYRDKRLCTKTYCYYVEAVQKNGTWTSRSNTVCKVPKYIPPSEPVQSVRTTVLPGNKTFTEWNRYNFVQDVDHYIVSRAYNGSSENDYYAKTDSLFFLDSDPFMETNKLSYTYKVRAVDHCGTESPKSVENRTILLTGKNDGYVAKIQWSEYSKWFSGVKEYNIFLREDNTFKLVSTIDTNLNTYEFDFLDTKLDDSVCFKVQAIKDTSEFVESYSNILCLISDAKVFVPSAFSPNGDGKNDVFIPKAILIFNKTGNPVLDYKLEIFNRWGEKVFETEDLQQGWDGAFKGETCQEGHYVYKVRALSLDGVTSFKVEGVVVLLR
jgi:gliding motility-associated-like protein